MKALSLLASLFIFSAVPAFAQESSTLPQSWKFGIGFGVLRNGLQGGFDVNTPSFFKFGKEDANLFGLFLDVGFIEMQDTTIVLGRLSDTSHLQGSFGVRVTDNLADRVQAYSKLGITYINWDADVKRTDGTGSSTGLLLAFGADVFVGKERYVAMGATASSVFIEFNWKSGHKRTDAIAGEPALFNGGALNFGYRMHY
ncbi:MAG TPA: hypothetical protein VFV50_02565 [Bdellovibrionales bacterium]|nr:hypothetical protein [Bdellovibrionales bacterium]